MIQEARGNILKVDAEALVNTVNCVGFMGKGIALQFKQAYPTNFLAYQKACRDGEVRPGQMFVFKTGVMVNPRYIINFPTKRHWRGKARLEDIEAGLLALVDVVKNLHIQSIAVPPLGCGNGGLDWDVVRPMIISSFEKLPDVFVLLYGPYGAPEATTMPIGTERPAMTVARALLLKLIGRYSELAYKLSLLEIQKLAYFLQESGERLRLQYRPDFYGPYAPNLNKVLEMLEGHQIRGYGDSQKPDAQIALLPGALREAEDFLSGEPSRAERLRRVENVIEGFETPYGMELLATVHWVCCCSEPRATDAESAIAAVHAWSARKQAMFRPSHIRIAWNRLKEEGWLDEPRTAQVPSH